LPCTNFASNGARLIQYAIKFCDHDHTALLSKIITIIIERNDSITEKLLFIASNFDFTVKQLFDFCDSSLFLELSYIFGSRVANELNYHNILEYFKFFTSKSLSQLLHNAVSTLAENCSKSDRLPSIEECLNFLEFLPKLFINVPKEDLDLALSSVRRLHQFVCVLIFSFQH